MACSDYSNSFATSNLCSALQLIANCNALIFFNGPSSASFSYIFVFSNKHYNSYNKCMWKILCSSSIWCRDSNPQSLEHQSPPLTTRPGLPPNCRKYLSTSNYFLFCFTEPDGSVTCKNVTIPMCVDRTIYCTYPPEKNLDVKTNPSPVYKNAAGDYIVE